MQAPFVHLMAANRPSHFRRPFRIFASLVPPAALFSSGSGSGAGVVKRIGTFPPFIALVTAPLLLPIHYPEWSITVLRRLGETLAPLALVSVGLQLRLDQLDGIKVPLTGGIAFKLLVGPALLVLVYVEILRATGNALQITIRIRHGAANRSVDRSHSAWPQPAADHTIGWYRHFGVISIAATLVDVLQGV